MTAIVTLTHQAQLPGTHRYRMFADCKTDAQALAEFRAMLSREKLNPAFADDTTGFRYRDRVWFAMDYGRELV